MIEKKYIYILALVLFSSCGNKLGVPSSDEDPNISDYLFTVIGMILAIAVANLVKGFDVLLKYSPSTVKSALLTTSRWQLRLLWGISLAFLIFQLTWGMRLALEEVIDLFFFFYYIMLTAMVYGMVVYVFPENLESKFEKEKKNKFEKYWTYNIINRMYKLYIIYGVYLASTIPMSIYFMIREFDKYNISNLFHDGNIFGILLKIFCFMILLVAIKLKFRQRKKLYGVKSSIQDVPVNNGKKIIKKWDYLVILMSIVIHFYYILIRTYELW